MKQKPAPQPPADEQERDDLPEGWADIELRDHIYIAGRIGWRGLKAEEYTSAGPILLSVPNLNYGDYVDFSKVSHISESRYEESPEIQLQVGDTLLVKDGAGIGKLGYVVSLPGRATVNSSLLVIRPGDDLLYSHYLFYYLKGPQFQDIALQRITGSSTPHLFQKDIKLFRVLVPPVPEQQRIVSTVRALSKQVASSYARLAKVPKILKAFRQSVLAAACSGRLTEDWRTGREEVELGEELLRKIDADRRETWIIGHRRDSKSRHAEPQCVDSDDLPTIPDTWTWATLDQIGQEGRPIVYGIIKPGPHVPKGVPYVRVTEMKDGQVVDVTELRRTSAARAARFERSTLAFGDILISKDGTIGRVAIVPPELAGGNVTQHVMRVPVHRFMDRDYVVATVRAPLAQRWLLGELKGVALQGVNVEDFRRLPIPVPPILEQREIVGRVAALFKLADKIEKRVSATTKRVDKLTQSILAKAFRGELVPPEAELARKEGRDYEPASVLLERIKSERAKSQTPVRVPRRRASSNS